MLAGIVEELKQKVAANGAGQTLAELGKQVTYARISKMWSQEFRKIEVSLVEGSHAANVWHLVITKLFEADKGERLEGTAPRGNLERQCQEMLDTLAPSTGGAAAARHSWE